MKWLNALGWACALLLVGFSHVGETRLASKKLFWVDERAELLETIQVSYAQTLSRGASGQCSPVPLYYLLQKAIVAHTVQFTRCGPEVLVKARWLSLVSASASALVMLGWLGTALGGLWGFGAVAALVSHPLYLHFAAENRPYVLWLLALSALLAWCARLSLRDDLGVSRRDVAVLLALGVALTLSVGPGYLQMAFALTALFVIHVMRRGYRGRELGQFAMWALPVTVAVTAVALFYVVRIFPLSRGCSEFGPWGMFNRPGWMDYFKGALRALAPKGETALNAWMFAGMVATFLSRRRKECATLGVLAFSQIAGAVIIAVLILATGYFFSNRNFIFFSICRSLFAVAGAYFAWSWLAARRWRFAWVVPTAFALTTGAVAWSSQMRLVRSVEVIGDLPQHRLPVDRCRATVEALSVSPRAWLEGE